MSPTPCSTIRSVSKLPVTGRRSPLASSSILLVRRFIGTRGPQCRPQRQSRNGRGEHSRLLGTLTHRLDELLDEATRVLGKLRCRRTESNDDAEFLDALAGASARLKIPRQKPLVAVFSLDSTSLNAACREDLVTALLEDPLSEDDERRCSIRDRWKRVSDGERRCLEIEFGPKVEIMDKRLQLPSPVLSQIPISLFEQSLTHGHADAFSSDIPVLLLPPLLPFEIPWSRIPVDHPRLLVVVNATTAAKTTQELQALIHSKTDSCTPRLLFVDSTRALKAIDTLKADPSSWEAIQTYQADFNGSNFDTLRRQLVQDVGNGAAQLRKETLRSLVSQILRSSRKMLRNAQRQEYELQCAISSLRESFLEERESTRKVMFGSDNAEESLVANGIENAGKEIKPVFDKLAWWRLPVAVDDISQLVTSAAERAYSKQFENKLVFQSGLLAALQSFYVSKTNTMMNSLPSTYRSPVLQNALSQQSSNPSFAVTSSSLLGILHSRLSQLSFATNRLHRGAQSALLTAFSSSSIFTMSGYGLWAAQYADAATAFGGSALLTMLALRYAVGRWERAKSSWWGDWARVGQGLGRDLRKSIESTLDSRVFLIPSKACDELENLAEKRREELISLEEDVNKLSSGLGETRGEK